MKGFLDFLTSDSGPAKELRDKFIFKIVPMLNPDGVIVGNNRCSLSAKDLNRQYRTVMRDAYPSIWYTKLMVRRFGIVVLLLGDTLHGLLFMINYKLFFITLFLK